MLHPDSVPLAASSGDHQAFRSPSRRRILLADDDVDIRSVMRRILRALGPDLHIDEVDNGIDLLRQVVGGASYDLLVSDVNMPWLSGLQAACQIRKAGLAVPVVFVTGCGDPRLPSAIEALGNASLLNKPFSATDLLHITREALHHDGD